MMTWPWDKPWLWDRRGEASSAACAWWAHTPACASAHPPPCSSINRRFLQYILLIEVTAVFIEVTAALHDVWWWWSLLPAYLAAVSNLLALAAELDAAPFVSAETQNNIIIMLLKPPPLYCILWLALWKNLSNLFISSVKIIKARLSLLLRETYCVNCTVTLFSPNILRMPSL